MSSSKRVKRDEESGTPSIPTRPTSPRDTDKRRTSLNVSPIATAPTASSSGLTPRTPIRRSTKAVTPPSLSPTGSGFMPSVGGGTASSSSSSTVTFPAITAPSTSSSSGSGEDLGRMTGGGSRRLAKLKQQETVRKLENAPQPGASHFGIDVSTPVWSAQRQYQAKSGGSDKNEREDTHTEIREAAVSSTRLSELLPNGMRLHVEAHLAQTSVPVSQSDLRVNASDGGSYSGAMFTSSYARERPDGGRKKKSDDETSKRKKSSAKAQEKITQDPSSPKPSDDHGPFHRAHASPFDVVGADSNDVRTVWGPQGGNLIVDKHIESAAIASKKRGDSLTMLLRSDTYNRSSVGVLSQTTPTGPYTLEAAQYSRRLGGGAATSSSGASSSTTPVVTTPTASSSSSGTSTPPGTPDGGSASSSGSGTSRRRRRK
ncbi:hypothetical protein GCM10007860_25360 [Chitiniphilus shinanonensis]|uniref:Uncharacterized protein n=1 Tax=Chitiniphilus shinanonensis TaxID=553088 RepID=A0ABQ6BUP8_9NEIS|nr:hypothetical protein [Chitiniphilus shinanonensis]GLS05384.1 hypothetical protein GCM10007860_25360 [Chitiniphilus shinanonensis]